MGLWGKLLFGSKPFEQEADGTGEHIVRLHIPLASEMPNAQEFNKYSKLEDVLDAAAQKAGAGELDGNQLGKSTFVIWLYGPNGPRLAEVVKLSLADVDLPPGATLSIRHGALEDITAKEESMPVR